MKHTFLFVMKNLYYSNLSPFFWLLELESYFEEIAVACSVHFDEKKKKRLYAPAIFLTSVCYQAVI